MILAANESQRAMADSVAEATAVGTDMLLKAGEGLYNFFILEVWLRSLGIA